MNVCMIFHWCDVKHDHVSTLKAFRNNRQMAVLGGVIKSVTSTFIICRSHNYKISTGYNYSYPVVAMYQFSSSSVGTFRRDLSVMRLTLISLLEPRALARSMQEKASGVEYITEYIHHFSSRLQILKVHCRNIVRKPHDIFHFSTLVGAKESTSIFFMHTNENSIQKKNKCRGSSMRSTSICSSGACVKLGQFTWEGTVGRFNKKKSATRHPMSMRCSMMCTVKV